MAQSSGGVICFLAWASGSVSHPPEKRAVALALINCVGQLGSILGSYVFNCTFNVSSNHLTVSLFFFFFSDISGHYPGDLRIIYLILFAQ